MFFAALLLQFLIPPLQNALKNLNGDKWCNRKCMDNDSRFRLYSARRIRLYSNLGVTRYIISVNDNINQPRNGSKHGGIHLGKSGNAK
jgi:hypothetical protein